MTGGCGEGILWGRIGGIMCVGLSFVLFNCNSHPSDHHQTALTLHQTTTTQTGSCPPPFGSASPPSSTSSSTASFATWR